MPSKGGGVGGRGGDFPSPARILLSSSPTLPSSERCRKQDGHLQGRRRAAGKTWGSCSPSKTIQCSIVCFWGLG